MWKYFDIGSVEIVWMRVWDGCKKGNNFGRLEQEAGVCRTSRTHQYIFIGKRHFEILKVFQPCGLDCKLSLEESELLEDNFFLDVLVSLRPIIKIK